MSKKWSLKAIFLLSALAALMFASAGPQDRFNTSWDETILPFVEGPLPKEFDGDYSYSISPKGTKSRTIVEDGRKIYPFLYAKGWELCLELFVRDDETWNRPDDPRNLLNEESSNPVEMHYVAMRDGYTPVSYTHLTLPTILLV